MSAIILSRVHRDALYQELLTALTEFGDLKRHLEGEGPDLEACERIGRRITDALRLIQDGGVGWGDTAPDRVVLTLPFGELRRIMVNRRSHCARALEAIRSEHERDVAEWDQAVAAREACSAVLEQIEGDE